MTFLDLLASPYTFIRDRFLMKYPDSADLQKDTGTIIEEKGKKSRCL
jgi:hypothetical protein